ncbi:MAG: ATP-binding cassette domain-containing protein [Planctomycetes bacterium]|nr:ATP-binding cassette domain-containing protein [Planctomycetota bacterium]
MIKATGLTMNYGSVVALESASFEVAKGEVVGLLGPNGAGKSTTMKILTTYLYPTSGNAEVGGKSILEEQLEVRRMIGYLPEVLPLYMNMEVGEYLDFVGRARGLDGAKLKERIDFVVDKCKLKKMFHRPIQELSKGYKQRTGLAQALIHDPEVLILDEPTSGLDPRQIQDIRDLVRELAKEKTIILSTHILQEAEAMADRIIIINNGKIVGQGTIGELREMAHETCRAAFAVCAGKEEVDAELEKLGAISHVAETTEADGVCRYVLVGPDDSAMIDELGKLVTGKGWQVSELAKLPYSLEETFLALTNTEKKGGAA